MFITLNTRNIFYKKDELITMLTMLTTTQQERTHFSLPTLPNLLRIRSRRLHFLFAIKFGNTLYIFEGIVAYRSTNRDVIFHNTDCACIRELPAVILPD